MIEIFRRAATAIRNTPVSNALEENTFLNAVKNTPDRSKLEMAKTVGKNVAYGGGFSAGAAVVSLMTVDSAPLLAMAADTYAGTQIGMYFGERVSDARAEAHLAKGKKEVLLSHGLDHDSVGTRLRHPFITAKANRAAWAGLTPRERRAIVVAHLKNAAWAVGAATAGVVAYNLSLNPQETMPEQILQYFGEQYATGYPTALAKVFGRSDEAKTDWKNAVKLAKVQGKAMNKLNRAESALASAQRKGASKEVLATKEQAVAEARAAYEVTKSNRQAQVEAMAAKLEAAGADGEVAASTEPAAPEVVNDVVAANRSAPGPQKR